MSSINGVSPSNKDIQLDKKARVPNQNMDKNAFMQLLVTQMQHQDPLNPMSNDQMMAQMAQFSALEQMTNVATVGEKQLANGLIGKFVDYQYVNPETKKIEYGLGKVDYVKHNGSNTTIGIGDHEVTMKDVLQVVDASNIQANTSPFDLIGKTVQAISDKKIAVTSDTSEPTEDPQALTTPDKTVIEGEVLGVVMKEGKPFVVIGSGKEKMEVDFKQVQNVVEKPSITGKQVTGTLQDKDGNDVTIQGIAEYVAILKDKQYVYVNEQFIPLENIQYITQAPK